MKYNITNKGIEINRNNAIEMKVAQFDGDIHLLPLDCRELRADLQTLQRVYERAITSANPSIAVAYLELEKRVIRAFEREAEPVKANHVAITTTSSRLRIDEK